MYYILCVKILETGQLLVSWRNIRTITIPLSNIISLNSFIIAKIVQFFINTGVNANN